MAETLTENTDPETTTMVDNLTPDEQDSLQVGEEMVNQQEQLLAGKYKNAEELEKAYGELQKKLGDKEAETTETKTEDKETLTDEEGSEIPIYLEDGSVNYDQVNQTYGDQLGNLFKDNNVDPWAISKHFHSNNGKITEEMYTQLTDTGLSREAVDSYLAGRSVEMGYINDETPDLTESDIRAITDSVGGKEQYDLMTSWAANNLDQKTVQAFDNLLDTGDPGSIQLAVNGLKAQFEEATGYEGRMLTGTAAKSTGDVFRSQPELVAAMEDPRYDRDPAYRQDIIEKLDRSNIQF